MRLALSLFGIEVPVIARQFGATVVVPQLLFYLGLREGTVTGALGAASGWAAATLVYEMGRRRGWDWLVLYGLASTVLQGAVALAVRSPIVYAGSGVAENLLDGLALLGSIAVCRPLLVTVLDAATRGRDALTRQTRAVVGRLTLVWGLGLLARAAALYVALTHLAIGPFLLVNTLAGWPLTGVGVLLSVLYLGRDSAGPAPFGAPRCSAPHRHAGDARSHGDGRDGRNGAGQRPDRRGGNEMRAVPAQGRVV